jgi:hypothetical protein
MSEATLRDERGCTAQSSRAYHCWTQTAHLRNGTPAARRRRSQAKDAIEKVERSKLLGEVQLYTADTWGNPVQGSQEMLCFLDPKCPKCALGVQAVAGPDQGARILGTHARLSVPQAPTLDARTVRRRDERQGQHSARRSQMLPGARRHLRACASTC